MFPIAATWKVPKKFAYKIKSNQEYPIPYGSRLCQLSFNFRIQFCYSILKYSVPYRMMANYWLCSDKVLSQIQKGWKAHLWRSILEHRNLSSPFKYLNKLILTLSEISIFKILLLGQCRKAMGWLTRYRRGILRSVESLRYWWVQKDCPEIQTCTQFHETYENYVQSVKKVMEVRMKMSHKGEEKTNYLGFFSLKNFWNSFHSGLLG